MNEYANMTREELLAELEKLKDKKWDLEIADRLSYDDTMELNQIHGRICRIYQLLQNK